MTIRHAKAYPSREAAENSAALRAGKGCTEDLEAAECTRICGPGTWHLEAKGKSAAAERKPAKATADSFPPAARALIDARDSDDSTGHPVRLCQGCGTTRGLQRHHRRGKDAGGSPNREHTHCVCNGLTLCKKDHDWAHAHPEAARAMGWIVSQSVDEPAEVGVMRFAHAEGGATQWPTCGGRWAGTAAEAREAA